MLASVAGTTLRVRVGATAEGVRIAVAEKSAYELWLTRNIKHAKLVLTKGAPIADMTYGIDNTFASRAADEGVLADYTPKDLPSSASSTWSSMNSSHGWNTRAPTTATTSSTPPMVSQMARRRLMPRPYDVGTPDFHVRATSGTPGR